MNYLRLFAILILAGTVQMQAQWSGSLSLGSGYDDNAFSNATALASSFGFASVELGYYPEEPNLALSYDGMLATYGDYPERRYSTHQLVGSYIFTYSGNSMLYTNGGFGVRLDAPEYEYYDYDQAYITLGSRHYIGEIMNLRAGYRFRYRQYKNFNDMSYGEHIGWLGVNTSFESRTSVTIRAELGAKQYSPIDNEYTAAPTLPQLVLDGGGGNGGGGSGGGGNGGGGNGSGGEGGSGNGGEGGSGNGNGGSGMGSGNGMHVGETTVGSGGLHSTQFITYDNTTTSQLRLAATVGQSITETTGISLNYVKRINLDDRSRAVVGGTVDFIGEEELFDDPYSYESDEATLKITQVINERMTLKVAGFGMVKGYSYPSDLSLLDLPGVPLREDRRFGGWAMLTYQVPGSWLLFSGLDVGVSYVYTRNESNTNWYDYSANDISIQVGTDF